MEMKQERNMNFDGKIRYYTQIKKLLLLMKNKLILGAAFLLAAITESLDVH